MDNQNLCYVRVGRLALTLTIFLWAPLIAALVLGAISLVTGFGLAALGMSA